MPIPVSLTRTTAWPPSRPAVSRMPPPGSVYLAALLSRLASTCSSRVGSASRTTGTSGSETINSWPPLGHQGRAASAARATTAAEVHHLLAEHDLAPADPRDVHQVVDQPGHVPHLPLRHRPLLAPCSGPPPCPFMRCRAEAIGASGLRSSWASMARNSSLRRSASRSACSARFRSVMSSAIPATRTTRPRSSRIGKPPVPDPSLRPVGADHAVLLGDAPAPPQAPHGGQDPRPVVGMDALEDTSGGPRRGSGGGAPRPPRKRG